VSHSTKTPIVLGHLLAGALLTLTACGGDGDSPSSSGEQASEQPSSSAPAGSEPDLEGIPEVVAEVNGEEITRDEFVATYQARFQQASMQAQMGGEAPDEEALKEQTAEGMVDTELLRQEAEQRGISASEGQVDDELTSLAKQNQLGSAQAFLDALADQGTTEEQARAQVETQVLIEGLVTDEVGEVDPTEQELRTLYQQVKQQQAQAGQQGGGQQVPPYAKVKPQLEQQARMEEQGRVAQELVERLRQDADITVNL
jgi:peptidyl-prolyl cis-trans isomerase SurA